MVEFEQLQPWKDKNAVILAVNSTLGVAIAKKLLELKMIVIGIDSDQDNIEDLTNNTKFTFRKIDLKSEDDIQELFQFIGNNYEEADLLVNVIQLSKSTSFLDSDTNDWIGVLNQHVLGYSLSIREFLRSMADRKVELSQIVNIMNFPVYNVSQRLHYRFYYMLKRTLNSFNRNMENELIQKMQFVRISSISNVLENLNEEQRRNGVEPSQFADALQYVITVPLHVLIREIELS